VLATVAVPSNGDAIVVPVTIDDREYPFVLDTGTSICVFDRSIAKLLGSPVAVAPEGARIGPGSDGFLYAAPPMQIGEMELEGGAVSAVMDVGWIAEAAGQELAGILGMSALRESVLELDFDQGKLLFADQPRDIQGETFDVRFVRNCPNVRLTLRTREETWFLVDTGFSGISGVTLDDATFAWLIESSQLEVLGSGLSRKATGDVKVRCGRLSALGVPPLEVQGPTCHERTLNKVGLRWLSRFHCVLNLRDGRLTLARGEAFDRSDPHDTSCIHLLWRSGKVIVDSLDADTIGAVSDLREGDAIAEVNGRAMDSFTLFELREALANREVTEFLVVRDQESMSIPLNWHAPVDP
jgi:hypothetical protein